MMVKATEDNAPAGAVQKPLPAEYEDLQDG